jgi:hypothetical protein
LEEGWGDKVGGNKWVKDYQEGSHKELSKAFHI